MSADEFWKDDPQLFVSYRTSFINKKERETKETDYICWLQGLYNYDGNKKIIDSLKQMLNNMFSKKKNTKKIDTYFNEPITVTKEKEKQKEIKTKKEIDRQKSYDNFHNSLIYYGTMKQRYLEGLKKKNGE